MITPVKLRPYIAPAKNLVKEYQNLRSRREVTVRVKRADGWFVQRMWYAHSYGYKHSEWLIVPDSLFNHIGEFVITEADYIRVKKLAYNGRTVTVTADVLEYRIEGYSGQMRHYEDPIARCGDRVKVLRSHRLSPLSVIVKPASGHCFEMFFTQLNLPAYEPRQ